MTHERWELLVKNKMKRKAEKISLLSHRSWILHWLH
jgi:hypothetical protein